MPHVQFWGSGFIGIDVDALEQQMLQAQKSSAALAAAAAAAAVAAAKAAPLPLPEPHPPCLSASSPRSSQGSMDTERHVADRSDASAGAGSGGRDFLKSYNPFAL